MTIIVFSDVVSPSPPSILPTIKKSKKKADPNARKFNTARIGPRKNKRKRKMKKINMLNIVRVIVLRMCCFVWGVSFLVSCVFTDVVSISPLSFFLAQS